MILINLYHGRLDPDEDMKGFGFDGPLLGPFPQFHMTYNNIFHLGDGELVIAGQEKAMPYWDKNDLFPFLGSYYGDVTIISKGDVKKSDSLQKRLELTNRIFKVPLEDLYKFGYSSEPWVKQYVSDQLRKGI